MSFLLDGFSITGFIATSLETLRQEFPTAYFLLCMQLAPHRVVLLIDGETVPLAFDPRGAHILPQVHHPTLQLHTTRQTILDVIDARLTLHEAVLLDALLLYGETEDLAAFHEGLLTYIRGAVRCPSFPTLLDDFRNASSRLLLRDNKADTR